MFPLPFSIININCNSYNNTLFKSVKYLYSFLFIIFTASILFEIIYFSFSFSIIFGRDGKSSVNYFSYFFFVCSSFLGTLQRMQINLDFHSIPALYFLVAFAFCRHFGDPPMRRDSIDSFLKLEPVSYTEAPTVL